MKWVFLGFYVVGLIWVIAMFAIQGWFKHKKSAGMVLAIVILPVIVWSVLVVYLIFGSIFNLTTKARELEKQEAEAETDIESELRQEIGRESEE